MPKSEFPLEYKNTLHLYKKIYKKMLFKNLSCFLLIIFGFNYIDVSATNNRGMEILQPGHFNKLLNGFTKLLEYNLSITEMTSALQSLRTFLRKIQLKKVKKTAKYWYSRHGR